MDASILLLLIGIVCIIGGLILVIWFSLRLVEIYRRDKQAEIDRLTKLHEQELERYATANRLKMRPEALIALEDVIGAIGGLDKQILQLYEDSDITRARANEMLRQKERALEIARFARGLNGKRPDGMSSDDEDGE